LRLQEISFFLVVVVVSALGFRLLWNYCFKSMPLVPRVKFRHALGLTVILSLLMLLVLTMISGARELLTPGAWRKQGSTYQLNSPASMEQRRARLLSLHAALVGYAESHQGKFPSHEFVPEVPPVLWESADRESTRFVYVAWAPPNQPQAWIALEPRSFGSQRLGLTTDGTVRVLSADELDTVFRGSAGP
jgi:hypothetical protein